MPRLLEGRRALVTGAASGIGKGMATLFASHGAQVLAVDINGDALSAAYPAGGSISGLVADISTADAAGLLREAASDVLGGLDILVNNAGIAGTLAPIYELSDEDWFKVIGVDLTPVFRITREFVPLLKQSAYARVINTGSVCSAYALPLVGAYTAAKHGVLGLTKAFALELGQFNITVNCLMPGSTITGITKDFFPGPETDLGRKYLDDATTLGRYATPEDIAGAAVYLASDLGSYVTGQAIAIDGGMVCKMPPLPAVAGVTA